MSAEMGDRTWAGQAELDMGIEVLAARSGLRGLRIGFKGSSGRSWIELADLTVISCNPSPCEDPEAAMADLGLLRR